MSNEIKKVTDNLNISGCLKKIKCKKKNIFKILTITLMVGILAAIITSTSIFSYAKSKVNYSSDQMKEIVLNMFPGQILSVKNEFNEDNFTFEKKFSIRDENNILVEATINSNTGVIVDFENYKFLN